MLKAYLGYTGQTRRSRQSGARAPVAATSARRTPPFRFHVLAVPHTVTRKDYSACAYTQKVLKFCQMMHRRGHTIYHYGHADSEVECTEKVAVTDNRLLEETYGNYDWKREIFKHNTGDLCNRTFCKRAIEAIGPRKRAGDFLLMFWGAGHAEVARAHLDLVAVEPGIGCFNAPSAPFNIFESYAVMNVIYGQQRMQPRWYDAVIPNYFDLADFEFEARPGSYFVFLGRIIESKGVKIAVEIAAAAGLPLKIAGQGDFQAAVGYAPPAHVELVGYVEPAERKELLRGSIAILAPTQYNEPFGGIIIEAMLCGTPAITSDWGGFAENNLHGVTGYRCRSMEQFVWAARNVGHLDRRACRAWAAANFSLERVAPMYEEYFQSLAGSLAGGDRMGNPGREELNWLVREYPRV